MWVSSSALYFPKGTGKGYQLLVTSSCLKVNNRYLTLICSRMSLPNMTMGLCKMLTVICFWNQLTWGLPPPLYFMYLYRVNTGMLKHETVISLGFSSRSKYLNPSPHLKVGFTVANFQYNNHLLKLDMWKKLWEVSHYSHQLFENSSQGGESSNDWYLWSFFFTFWSLISLKHGRWTSLYHFTILVYSRK